MGYIVISISEKFIYVERGTHLLLTEEMAACENKKMSFSIENLAKSSRTEEQTDEDYGFYFMNTNAWQNGQLFNMAARCFSNNPLYNATAQTPSGDNVFYSRGIIRESSRLSSVSPDSGYSSQNSTPSASGSYSKKRMRRVPAVVLSPSEAGSGSQKRKRPDTDDECSDGKVTPDIVANNRLESVCQASGEQFIDLIEVGSHVV